MWVVIAVLVTPLLTACSLESSAISPTDASADGRDTGGDVPLIPDAEPPAWWRSEYRLRRAISISAATVATPAAMSLYFTADTGAIISAGEARPDGNDWRVVRHGESGAVELDRWIDDGEGSGWNGGDTRTWFLAVDDVPRQTVDALTYLYYSRADETGDPPDDMLEVFVFGDDFETDLSLWTENGRGETAQLEAAEARAGGAALSLATGVDVLGGLHRNADLPEGNLSFTFYFRRVQPGSVALVRVLSVAHDERDLTWVGPGVRVHAEINVDGEVQFVRRATGTISIWAEVTDSAWHRAEVVWDQTNALIAGGVDGSDLSTFYPEFGDRGQPARSFAIEGQGERGVVQIDNYVIRRYLDRRPTVTLGEVELAP